MEWDFMERLSPFWINVIIFVPLACAFWTGIRHGSVDALTTWVLMSSIIVSIAVLVDFLINPVNILGLLFIPLALFIWGAVTDFFKNILKWIRA
jgi:hypothetical protein